ncbi:MAG: transposase [Deltaproteobacteria bacterium]|nr:transposase [Deltaproteobacteria bacterium]MBI3388353.1 transposase [Deltaproteobacteria bacterium]
MPQSLASVLVHLIFGTKNREPKIPRELLPQLHAYMVGIFDNLQCPSVRTGGIADHVHSLFSLSRTATIAAVVEAVKTGSSKWMKQRGVKHFAWQAGYAAFSVSESQKAAVMRYIERQEERHKRQTFQDEVRTFLTRHGVTYDDRYVWD